METGNRHCYSARATSLATQLPDVATARCDLDASTFSRQGSTRRLRADRILPLGIADLPRLLCEDGEQLQGNPRCRLPIETVDLSHKTA